MQKNEAVSETEHQTRSLWPVLCAAITGIGMAVFCSTLWGRTPKATTLFLTLGTIAFGALLGLSLRNTKRARNVSFLLSLVFFIVCFALGRYLVSDSVLAKKEWQTHTIGLTRFSYPSEFTQKTVPDGFLQNGEVSIFTNENTNRYATYMVYQFTDFYPALEDSLSSAVLSMLSSFGAHFEKWDLQEEIFGDTIKTRFTYTLKDKTFTGIAYGAQAITDETNARYELLLFFPLRKKYSKALMERIENEIQTN